MKLKFKNLMESNDKTWKHTSRSKLGNIWSKTETESSDPDPKSDDRTGDPKVEHLDLFDEVEEDPKISSKPTRFPQTPADIAS